MNNTYNITDMLSARTETLLACARNDQGVYPRWLTNDVVDILSARGIRYVWDGNDWEFRYIRHDGSYGPVA